jgi:hypothetical protein
MKLIEQIANGVTDRGGLLMQQQIRRVWKLTNERETFDIIRMIGERAEFWATPNGFMPAPGATRARVTLELMKSYKHFGLCENPDCPAPYYVKSRKDRRSCSQEACKVFIQRRSALRWWHKKGKHRRAAAHAKK